MLREVLLVVVEVELHVLVVVLVVRSDESRDMDSRPAGLCAEPVATVR